MEHKLQLGRLVDHIHLVVRDFEASKRFYRAILRELGIAFVQQGADYFSADELFISSQQSPTAAGELSGRIHLAFQARDRATVDRFHDAGLAAGGKDHGAPGVRPYHPGYYAAFLLDPDGNNIEAVFHGEAQRSAEAVAVTYQA